MKVACSWLVIFMVNKMHGAKCWNHERLEWICLHQTSVKSHLVKIVDLTSDFLGYDCLHSWDHWNFIIANTIN